MVGGNQAHIAGIDWIFNRVFGVVIEPTENLIELVAVGVELLPSRSYDILKDIFYSQLCRVGIGLNNRLDVKLIGFAD